MNKKLKVSLIAAVVIFLIGTVICWGNIIRARNYDRLDAVITFIGTPDGDVFGDFTDTKDVTHTNTYLYSDSRFGGFFSLKTVKTETLEKQTGKTVKILYDPQTNDIIVQSRLITETAVFTVLFAISCITFIILGKKVS